MAPETVRPPPADHLVTYWAISVLSSHTMWFNAISFALMALDLNEVTAIIPPRFAPLQLAITALGNMYLRFVTVRPVAFIPAGASVPVDVPRIVTPPPTGSAP